MDVLVVVVVAPGPDDVDRLSHERMEKPWWSWAYMLRGWSEGPGSKYRRGLWIGDWADWAAAVADGLKVNNPGRRLLIVVVSAVGKLGPARIAAGFCSGGRLGL
jgi:hypothetical protein